MEGIHMKKASKFDKSFLAWMLVAQVVVIITYLYLGSTGFFNTLPV